MTVPIGIGLGVLAALVVWTYFGRMARLVVVALGFAALYTAVHPTSAPAVLHTCHAWLSERSCNGVQAGIHGARSAFEGILAWMKSIQ